MEAPPASTTGARAAPTAVTAIRRWAASLVVAALLVAAASRADDTATEAPARELRYVTATRARVRAAPSSSSAVVEVLRIGRAVRVVARRGGLLEVETGVTRGFVAASLVDEEAPTRDALLRAVTAAPVAGRRTAAQRLVALVPSDEEAIALLRDALVRAGARDAAHTAEKGLIAAERRNLSWDGPLFPIVDDRALVPAPCTPGVAAATRADARRVTDVPTLRGRAFPLVSSGKVVRLDGAGNTTVRLDAELCVAGPCGAPQRAFAFARGASDGALVPSWLVAGFDVAPFHAPVPAPTAACASCARVDGGGRVDVELDDAGRRARLVRHDASGPVTSAWSALPFSGARPVVHFAEDEAFVLVLWRARAGRACCGDEAVVWLTRWKVGEGAPLDVGRAFTEGHAAACPGVVVGPLPGEPRCARLPEGCMLGAE